MRSLGMGACHKELLGAFLPLLTSRRHIATKMLKT